MRNEPLHIKRLPFKGRRVGGGYFFSGSEIINTKQLPELPPLKTTKSPSALSYRAPLLKLGYSVASKIRYKNVSPGRRTVWPRRRIIRTASKPRFRSKFSLQSSLVARKPRLRENPVFKTSYKGHSSFRLWIIFWYWGLSHKRAKLAREAHDFVLPKEQSFSKWPKPWIGSRQEHLYITPRSGRCVCLYHSDTASIVEVLSVICYTLASFALNLEIKFWPLLWINSYSISTTSIMGIISDSLLFKLYRVSDWPPLIEFLLDSESSILEDVITNCYNRNLVNYYDNVIVCSYHSSKSGMALIAQTWNLIYTYLSDIAKVEKLADRKWLTIPSEVPITGISLPTDEGYLPRKNIIPNYFFGHGVDPILLESIRQKTPWAVKDDLVILIYKRYRRSGHRGALRELVLPYYKDALLEARRTDIRGMKYDIRMVESVTSHENLILGKKLPWLPIANQVALGTWQALPRRFASTFLINFEQLPIITVYKNIHEVAGVIANFSQAYSCNSNKLGISLWPWKDLQLLRKSTWCLNVSTVVRDFNILNIYLNNIFVYWRFKNKLVYLLNIINGSTFSLYGLPGGIRYLLFNDLTRLHIGIAFTMLAYFTLNLRQQTNVVRVWYADNLRLPLSFFSNSGWSTTNDYADWRVLKHSWMVFNFNKLKQRYSLYSWVNIKQLCCLKAIQNSIVLQYIKQTDKRYQIDCANAQFSNIWTHLLSLKLNYPTMRPIKTILKNWVKLLPIKEYPTSLSTANQLFPVEAISAPILRTWLQIRPDASYRRQIGFRLLKLRGSGFPKYQIGKLQILFTKVGSLGNVGSNLAAWPKWFGYGRGWTGHLTGNWISPEDYNNDRNLNMNIIDQSNLLKKINVTYNKADLGNWVLIFFRAPLGAWQALAVTALLLYETKQFLDVTLQIRVWHGGWEFPIDFCLIESWDSLGRYKWPERLLIIWHRTTIAWVERRVRGRRKYNRRYSRLPSETRARAIQLQCIRIRFPHTVNGIAVFKWIRRHYIYMYGFGNRALYLHKAENELAYRWSQLYNITALSDDD